MSETISLSLKEGVAKGSLVHVYGSASSAPEGGAVATSRIHNVRAGDVLDNGDACFKVVSFDWMVCAEGRASKPMLLLEAMRDIDAGEMTCAVKRVGYTLAWITLSDKGAAGKRSDESGPLIGKLVGEALDLVHVQGFIIPDEISQLKGLLVDLALNQGFDIIMTTGGTGVGPRDITPEATLPLIEKRLHGYERAMTAASLAKTPHGAISRAVAGTLGQSIIVNMPGSPKAVAECLEPLLPTLRHTLEKLQGDPSDCATLRQ